MSNENTNPTRKIRKYWSMRGDKCLMSPFVRLSLPKKGIIINVVKLDTEKKTYNQLGLQSYSTPVLKTKFESRIPTLISSNHQLDSKSRPCILT